MELALAIALAVVLFLAFSAFMARGIERERAQRLTDELQTLRRVAPVAPSPARPEAAEEPPRKEPAPSGLDPAAVSEARQRLTAALEEARRLAAYEPPMARRVEETDHVVTLVRSLEPLLAGLGAVAAERAPEAERLKELPGPLAPLPVDTPRASVDELLEELRHLGADLLAFSRADARRGEATGTLGAALARAERLAAPLATFHAVLSGLADRVNLLALNVAVLGARPGPEGAVFQEAERELRNVYSELRRAGGELSTLTQRSADAARGARESSIDRTDRATAAEGALTAPLERWRRAEEKAQLVAAQLLTLDTAARESEERARFLGQAAGDALEESRRHREALERIQDELRRRAAEAQRAAELAGRLVDSIGRVQTPAPGAPAAPSMAPLLQRLDAALEAFENLDSGPGSRTH